MRRVENQVTEASGTPTPFFLDDDDPHNPRSPDNYEYNANSIGAGVSAGRNDRGARYGDGGSSGYIGDGGGYSDASSRSSYSYPTENMIAKAAPVPDEVYGAWKVRGLSPGPGEFLDPDPFNTGTAGEGVAGVGVARVRSMRHPRGKWYARAGVSSVNTSPLREGDRHPAAFAKPPKVYHNHSF